MPTIDQAIRWDAIDPLRSFRAAFHFPINPQGEPYRYFCGNSLGLQPKAAKDAVERELDDWAKLAVMGHHAAKLPWYRYHEFLTETMAQIVGAKNHEVVVANTLTVNLHLMLSSFYRPTANRNKIIIEQNCFPSDRYAVESHIRNSGFDPKEALLVMQSSSGGDYISQQEMEEFIKSRGQETALLLLGNVNYYSGQAYPIRELTRWAHEQGCYIGFDLAHGAGNLLLELHDDGPDFAVWCGYKYLNGGPGSLGGIFVHERHAYKPNMPRLAGWWGHNKNTRFLMPPSFDLMEGAEGWQLSNPPILPMACLRVSLQIFADAGMGALRKKSLALTAYLIDLIEKINHPNLQIITPKTDSERGCQISLRVKNASKDIFTRLEKQNIIADWREPDVIRVAPVPLYNSFEDIYCLYLALKNALDAD